MPRESHLHRERPELLNGPDCTIAYCSECIPGGEDNFSGGEPRRPLCSRSLDYLGGGLEAEPFWRRGPDLLRYALKTGPSGVAVLAAVLFMIGSSSLLTLFLLLIAYLALISYGLEITVRIVQGYWWAWPIATIGR